MLLLPEQLKGEAVIGVPQAGEHGWWELLGEKPLCLPPHLTLVLVPLDLFFVFLIVFLLFLSCVLLILST